MLVLQLAEFAVDVGVVDFAGAGFVPPWNVGHVDEADDVDVFLLQFFYQISFGDLFMENVVEESDCG